jgi:hypothetical protein
VETGELTACSTVSTLSRRGRSKVKVRVIGDCSLGWVEMAEGWVARIDAVVFGEKPCQVIRWRFSHLTRIDFTSAMNLCVRKPWDGIGFATVNDAEAADAVRKLVER